MNGNQDANAKVLVGCPVSDFHEYCTKEYVHAIKNLTYKNYDPLLVDNSQDDKFFNSIKDQVACIRSEYSDSPYERVIRCRNILREKALKEGYDYFLSLEQDVIPPSNVIEMMLRQKKDLLTGVYFLPKQKGDKVELIATMWTLHPEDKTKKVDISNDIILGKHLLKISLCGLGCILISRKVLEKIKFRHDPSIGDGIDDVFFCHDARQQGFEIYADTSIKCKHLIKGRNWYWLDLIKDHKLKK